MYVAALEQIDSPVPSGVSHPSSKLPPVEAGPNGTPSASPSKETTLKDYETIGDALLVCEASSYVVGIPWMLPVGDVAGRRYTVGTLPGDYIRETLVTVSTNCLQMYIEDLDRSCPKQLSDAELYIEVTSWTERYSFVAACSAAFAFIGCVGASYLFMNAVACVICGIGMMVLGYVFGQSFATSEARRRSFQKLLSSEAMRRRGIDPNGPAGTHVYTGRATPLSE